VFTHWEEEIRKHMGNHPFDTGVQNIKASMRLRCRFVMSKTRERCSLNPLVECVMVGYLDLRLLDVNWPQDLEDLPVGSDIRVDFNKVEWPTRFQTRWGERVVFYRLLRRTVKGVWLPSYYTPTTLSGLKSCTVYSAASSILQNSET